MSNVAVVAQKPSSVVATRYLGGRAAEKPHIHRISAVDGEVGRLSDGHRLFYRSRCSDNDGGIIVPVVDSPTDYFH